ncbi:MAG: hypothetical protein KBT04_03140 [Bacteroidales bacterium]|nr:hypothetical protein [Candidatus Colimorpha onthohippi]
MKLFTKLLCPVLLFLLSVACSKDPDEEQSQPNIEVDCLEGCLPGVFSVSETKTVRFSQGNLQYSIIGTHRCADDTSLTGTWRFAANQYDYIGRANEDNSGSDISWIDLFGWGTSGYNNCIPQLHSTNNSDYGALGCNNLTESNANYDWGVYNAISNGGNEVGKWRTLTKDEWEYLLNNRANASSKCGHATVNGVNGVVLLPDSWTLPENCTFIAGHDSWWTTNVYTEEQWEAMEAKGALFLPDAGYRYGTTDGVFTGDMGGGGYYWTSTVEGSSYAYGLYFFSHNIYPDYDCRNSCLSVRLVCE